MSDEDRVRLNTAFLDLHLEPAFDPDPTGAAYGETLPLNVAPLRSDHISSNSFVSSGTAGWPAPMAKVAYHGVAGDFVRLVGPHTEADPSAVLAQFLVAFGNVITGSAHFMVGADRHRGNLFVVLVGETSKGRKGSSWSPVRFVFRQVDDAWATSSGLSSGEGLIWAVRDPIEKLEPIKEKGRVVRYETVMVDAGVTDKRLTVIEPEFASTLRMIERDGNTLSALIRQAWDDGDLRVMTKNSPARATAAHISIVGHVTGDELRRYLDRTEQGNGFANRILWIAVRRSKRLPEGGEIDQVNLGPLVDRLRLAVMFARDQGQLRRDEGARALWRSVYDELSEGRSGMLGAITSRAEAQVTRLALLYALLDGATEIRKVHLEAALAFWRYCEDSAAYIFGGSLGDPDADTISAALQSHPAGMTRVEISNLFSRNKESSQIDRVLGKLVGLGLARSTREATGGRPVERWWYSNETNE